jgi:hypothetical protein
MEGPEMGRQYFLSVHGHFMSKEGTAADEINLSEMTCCSREWLRKSLPDVAGVTNSNSSKSTIIDVKSEIVGINI